MVLSSWSPSASCWPSITQGPSVLPSTVAIPQGPKFFTSEPKQEFLLKCHLFYEAIPKIPSSIQQFIYLSHCSDLLLLIQFIHIHLLQEALDFLSLGWGDTLLVSLCA